VKLSSVAINYKILKWPECSGIGGRNQAEWVADLFRNWWPEWSGIRRCDPIKLLRDVWGSLKPGGVLIIVNQGEAEHRAQKDMLLLENIRPAAAFQHLSQLYQYKLVRYVLVAINAA
ncbi:MAG: hypothetical protein KJ550_02190, partial [Proteobacteria bacterium]|nr:hypothetical protein [Pseudomonadota bacterium]MBU4012260.1 hypothetical protein [Pseudomonadota bacterium]MBU4067715.1 hypothetical protein [Pseudomonadota bacterium]